LEREKRREGDGERGRKGEPSFAKASEGKRGDLGIKE